MSVRWRGWCFSAEVEKEYDCLESCNKAQGDRMGFMIREVMCPSLQWPRMPGNFSQMLKTSLGTSVLCMKITPEAVIGQEAGYTPNRSLVCCRANPRKSLDSEWKPRVPMQTQGRTFEVYTERTVWIWTQDLKPGLSELAISTTVWWDLRWKDVWWTLFLFYRLLKILYLFMLCNYVFSHNI